MEHTRATSSSYTVAPSPPGRARSRGISLVLVVSVMLILIVVATGFAAFTSQDMRTSQTVYEQNETYFLAESGIEYGLFLIKHSMLVFPAPPAALLETTYWNSTTKRTTPLYNADSNAATGTGGLDARGSLINHAASLGGLEHVVISDLGYAAGRNWMSDVRTCGTFLLKHTVTTPAATDPAADYKVTFTSTGYIKQIPTGVDITTLSSGVPTGFNNVGADSWTVLAQRTLVAVIYINRHVTGNAGTTAVRSLQVKEFREQFR